jgi:hypothetical protein
MRTLVAILLAAVLLLPATAPATIWYVPDNFASIQAGIDGIPEGDTLVVREDAYYENLDFNGHNIVLASLFLLDGDPAHVENTVIDGSQSGTVITLSSGEDSTAQIVGFTVQNGYDYEGGGVHCYDSHPGIRDNIIRANAADWYGGGIFGDYSNSKITNNTISGNRADTEGGGIYCTHSQTVISKNIIVGNWSYDWGGGICCWYCWDTTLTIEHNVIIADSAQFGGGIGCYGAHPTITNNVIVGNRAEYDGGGISSDGNATITGNTITMNSAGEYGGGFFCRGGSPTIMNTILWEDTAPEIYVMSGSPTVAYCDVQGGWQGQGNIDADPIFVGPDEEDYYLRWHSPCIDAGHPSLRDPDGTRSEIGAFYFNQDVYGIIELHPHNTPIIIPPQGGQMTYEMWVFSFVGHPGRADIWTMAFVPGVGSYGPINLYRNVRIPADSIGLNDVGQKIPGPAPAGDYVFAAYVGVYPSTIIDSSYFYFSKQGSVVGEMGEWSGNGLSLEKADVTAFDLPSAYALFQNYPNPFNVSTTINYQLPSYSHVRLELYNILGEKIGVLVDEMQETGYKSVSWDASEISSGVYLYKLTAGDFSETKRMMLVK